MGPDSSAGGGGSGAGEEWMRRWVSERGFDGEIARLCFGLRFLGPRLDVRSGTVEGGTVGNKIAVAEFDEWVVSLQPLADKNRTSVAAHPGVSSF